MSKKKDGVFSLLRQILAEQKKQTKMLETIVSSQEHSNLIQLTGSMLKLTSEVEELRKS